MLKNYGKPPGDSAERLLSGSAASFQVLKNLAGTSPGGDDLARRLPDRTERRKLGAWLSGQDVDSAKGNLPGLVSGRGARR